MDFEKELTNRVLDNLENAKYSTGNLVTFQLDYTYNLFQSPTAPYGMGRGIPYMPPPTDEDIWGVLVNSIVSEITTNYPSLKIHSIRNAIDSKNYTLYFSIHGSYS